MSTEVIEKEDIVVEDNQLVCILSHEVKKIKTQEKNLQSVMNQLLVNQKVALVN
jgi:type I restriction enzyme M protein